MAKKNCLGGANGGRGSINEAAAAPEKRVIPKERHRLSTVYESHTDQQEEEHFTKQQMA
jgi:hypothetical protein